MLTVLLLFLGFWNGMRWDRVDKRPLLPFPSSWVSGEEAGRSDRRGRRGLHQLARVGRSRTTKDGTDRNNSSLQPQLDGPHFWAFRSGIHPWRRRRQTTPIVCSPLQTSPFSRRWRAVHMRQRVGARRAGDTASKTDIFIVRRHPLAAMTCRGRSHIAIVLLYSVNTAIRCCIDGVAECGGRSPVLMGLAPSGFVYWGTGQAGKLAECRSSPVRIVA